MQPLSDSRDMLPEGRQIYALELTYNCQVVSFAGAMGLAGWGSMGVWDRGSLGMKGASTLGRIGTLDRPARVSWGGC